MCRSASASARPGQGPDLEPLFYRGSGFTASDAVFTIIWRGFSVQKKQNNFFKFIFLIFFKLICTCTPVVTLVTLVTGWHCSRVSRSE